MYVKQLELTRFKSFGSTTSIPLLPGFTVISGPNGSGKSNILDAVLFALGLSSSKGMRADKLLDLVHSGSLERGRKVETSVAVTFALESAPPEFLERYLNPQIETEVTDPEKTQDEGEDPVTNQSSSVPPADGPSSTTYGSENGSANGCNIPTEWKVTRRLRVNPASRQSGKDEPSYTSTFYINDVPCTLTELHEQLEAMHVYPNGYNVVLQGDVTRIISMNTKERRQIIDELAGVANFDRKIAQANTKLEAVKEQIERFRLIEQELQSASERLLQESKKAQDYQKLRAHLNQLDQQKLVLTWKHIDIQYQHTQRAIQTLIDQQTELSKSLETAKAELQTEEVTLTEMQSRIHALGEDEYLAKQKTIATWQARHQQQQHQLATWTQDCQDLLNSTTQAQAEQNQLDANYATLQIQQEDLILQAQALQTQVAQHEAAVQKSRDRLQVLAQSSDAWVKQQRYLTRQLEDARQDHGPREQEHIRLTEKIHQFHRQDQDLAQEIEFLQAWIQEHEPQTGSWQTQVTETETRVQQLATELANLQSNLEIEQATFQRLQTELHTKQRELDKLETRRQVLQDTQGSRATQVVLAAKLPGVCGLVAQLGQVDPAYQVALEIAAGSRLNYVVVDDDIVAASAINFLKREKAGRATFLPLNKLKATRPPGPMNVVGAIDYAIRLVSFDNKFRDVFGFVFSQTIVFESLDRAQPHIGKYRMVTLEGDLLETSGAMTGGSQQHKSSARFGADDSQAVELLKERLDDIEELLATLGPRLKAAQAREKTLIQDLTPARQNALKTQQQLERHQAELKSHQDRLTTIQTQRNQLLAEKQQAAARILQLNAELDPLKHRLDDLGVKLSQLEHSPVNQHWQQVQAEVQQHETALSQTQSQLRDLEQRQQSFTTQRELNRAKYQQHTERITDCQTRAKQIQAQIDLGTEELGSLTAQIQTQQAQLAELETRLADLRQKRDQQEFTVRSKQQHIQRVEWERYNAETQQHEKEAIRDQLQSQRQQAQVQLPDPLPEVPDDLTLESLQRQRKRTEDKLRALEPVNMLAIQEYEETQARLEGLSEKLGTLEQERTELLLRIENFSTLRCQAFLDAFEAVDQHFQSIFSQLSDGDGHLELENKEDPFTGGLTLVAHPKGKQVRRLSSMSGGEKSLTALSFIFALQRYRPSSFYVFDEVDMFLDGANVEKLATMIWQQAQQAQFIVVSLRRPMIEKSERTIGVTQARGAFTQVIGIKNPS